MVMLYNRLCTAHNPWKGKNDNATSARSTAGHGRSFGVPAGEPVQVGHLLARALQAERARRCDLRHHRSPTAHHVAPSRATPAPRLTGGNLIAR